MAKIEWGVKRLCPGCGARFYDMRLRPIVCPSCETNYAPEDFLKTRRSVRTAEPTPRAVVAKGSDDTDDSDDSDDTDTDDTTDTGDDAEELIEDASELGEDDDDMVDAIEDEEEDR